MYDEVSFPLLRWNGVFTRTPPLYGPLASVLQDGKIIETEIDEVPDNENWFGLPNYTL